MIQNALLSTFIAQLCLALVAMAAPVEETVMTTSGGNAWQYGTGGGILGLIVLVLDVIVFSTFAYI
jgi:hypothetical protein